jgi:hypothetical protein
MKDKQLCFLCGEIFVRTKCSQSLSLCPHCIKMAKEMEKKYYNCPE